MNVEPRGFPTFRRLWSAVCPDAVSGVLANVVLRRNSWVMAMPMLAKARDVRSQARKVRSARRCKLAPNTSNGEWNR